MGDSLALPLAALPQASFWRRHALWPALALGGAFLALEILGWDRPIAHALFFDDATHRWLGSGAGDWWAHQLLHDGGRWVARGIAAGALAVWLLSFRVAALAEWRRPSGYAFVAMLCAIVLVGGLKTITNVDCPWDLLEFGGSRPYVALFADRPDALPHAQCFPGAHSSSGFALLCFYFALRDRRRQLARWALAAAVAVGVLFSIGQQARGAHFITHDLASAAIVWFVQLGLYAWMLKPRAASGGRR